jgi:hypothetical protein
MSSKAAFIGSGAASIAASVPVMHFVNKRFLGDPTKQKVTTIASMVMFLLGWTLLGVGLTRGPDNVEVTQKWSNRQIALVTIGILLIVIGVGSVRYGERIKIPFIAGAAAFVSGWAVLTASFVYSDPDFDIMEKREKIRQVLSAITSSLTVVAGAALISMSDGSSTLPNLTGGKVKLNPKTLEAVAATVFGLGWLNVFTHNALE